MTIKDEYELLEDDGCGMGLDIKQLASVFGILFIVTMTVIGISTENNFYAVFSFFVGVAGALSLTHH